VIIGLLVAIAGVALVLKHALLARTANVANAQAPLIERIAVFATGGIALAWLVAMLVLVGISGRTTPQFFAATISILSAIAAPLVLWRTRWRGIAEGAAIIALGVLVYLTSATFGLYLIPFAFLLMVGAAKGVVTVQENLQR
jgi:hypothetical protein